MVTTWSCNVERLDMLESTSPQPFFKKINLKVQGHFHVLCTEFFFNKIHFKIFYWHMTCVCMCAHACEHLSAACGAVDMQEIVIFHYVHLWGWAEVMGFGGRHLYSLIHPSHQHLIEFTKSLSSNGLYGEHEASLGYLYGEHEASLGYPLRPCINKWACSWTFCFHRTLQF